MKMFFIGVLKVFGVFWFISALIGIIALLSGGNELFTPIERIVIPILMFGIGSVGLLPLRNKRILSSSNVTIPREELQSIKRHYSPMTAKQDIRILQDCATQIQTTTNFETYFMRKELGIQKATILWEAEQAKVKGVKHTSQLVQNFQNAAEHGKVRILLAAYENTLADTQIMKTTKGKVNRWNKLIDAISRYQSEFESVPGYEEMKKMIEQQIEQLNQIQKTAP